MYRLTRHVIVEGANGSGKTTLIQSLKALGLASHHTGGPKHSAAEIFTCMNEVAGLPPSVIDRVPAISQVVYDRACERDEHCPPEQVWKTYFSWPRRHARGTPVFVGDDPNPLWHAVVVYCRPSLARLLAHEPHEGATHPEEHLQEIRRNRQRIVGTYDRLISELSARSFIRLVFYDWEAGSTPQSVVTILMAVGVLKREAN